MNNNQDGNNINNSVSTDGSQNSIGVAYDNMFSNEQSNVYNNGVNGQILNNQISQNLNSNFNQTINQSANGMYNVDYSQNYINNQGNYIPNDNSMFQSQNYSDNTFSVQNQPVQSTSFVQGQSFSVKNANSNGVPNSFDPTIYCTRCGAELKSSSRYCMKCGNLNYDHNANEKMRQYIDPNENNSMYNIGGAKKAIICNTGSNFLSFITTFSIFLFMLLITFVSNIDNLTGFKFSVTLFMLSMSFVYIYGLELMFMKSNNRWWAIFVPIYNIFVLSKIVYGKASKGILAFIPVVNIFYFISLLYNLGLKFSKSGFFTVLLPFIMIPVIGWGSSSYNGNIYIEKDQKKVESIYFRQKLFGGILAFSCIASLVLVGLINRNEINKYVKYVGNFYYVYTAKRAVSDTKNKIRENIFYCKNGNYSTEDGTYYFHYGDVGKKIFLPFYLSRDSIEVYVKIVRLNDEEKYYVTLTDEKLGFEETDIDDVNLKTVKKFKNIDFDFENTLYCEFGIDNDYIKH